MTSFLSIVVDCNAFNWGLAVDEFGPSAFRDIISAIIALCNAHLFSSLGNRLLLLAEGIEKKAKKLFTNEKMTKGGNGAGGDGETFGSMIEDILQKALLANAEANQQNGTVANFSRSVSLSICAFHRFRKRFPNCSGNIALLNLSSDLSTEQNSLMNLFFAARQHSLHVHVVSLLGSVPILQQACDITHGNYVQISDPKLLAHNLLSNCRTVDCQNAAFNRSLLADIDYRAACHCHNTLLDIGWVCSVCLAVTCNCIPFCKICNAVFPRPPISAQKRNAISNK